VQVKKDRKMAHGGVCGRVAGPKPEVWVWSLRLLGDTFGHGSRE
jgi:hypothetical protein